MNYRQNRARSNKVLHNTIRQNVNAPFGKVASDKTVAAFGICCSNTAMHNHKESGTALDHNEK
jgi:hypothetical protein